MKRKLRDDCFLHDKDRLTHAEAIEILKSRISPIVDVESVSLSEAAGRILMEDILAPRPVPWHTNAAVDGYAISHDHYDQEQGSTFEQTARIAAGHDIEGNVSADCAAHIFTGAVVPEIFDTIVMQEDVEIEEKDDYKFVTVPSGLKRGANRRLAGEDLKTGDMVMKAGTRLRPQDLAGIASTGQNAVKCAKKLRVAMFSTGDEIHHPAAIPRPVREFHRRSKTGPRARA